MIGSRDQPKRFPFQFQGVRSTPRTNYRPLKINPDGKLIKLSALRTRAVGNIGGGEIDHQKPAVGIDAFEWRIRLLGIRALPPPHRARCRLGILSHSKLVRLLVSFARRSSRSTLRADALKRAST